MEDVPSAEDVIAALRKHPGLYQEVGVLMRESSGVNYLSRLLYGGTNIGPQVPQVDTGRFSSTRAWEPQRLRETYRPLGMVDLPPGKVDIDYVGVELRLLAQMHATGMLSNQQLHGIIVDGPENEP